MDVIRVGIAGYGVVGKKRRQVIDSLTGAEVVAICDRKFSREFKAEEGVNCRQDYQDILRDGIDTLFVCLSNDMLAEVTKAGLEQGLNVFCEKPPGRSVSEIEAVIEVENRHPKLRLRYGFNHRHHGSVEEALSIVNSEEMGSVINIRGVYGKSKIITFAQDDWRTKRELAGGGILLDQGIHLVDLLRLFGGEYALVHSIVSNRFWGYDVEDNAYALMKSDRGVVAMLHSSATQWRHRFHLEITLEAGALILSGILTDSKSYGAETLTIVNSNPETDAGDPWESTKIYYEDKSWEKEVTAFFDSIRGNYDDGGGSSMEALKTMQLVNEIYASDKEWKTRHKLGIG